MPTPTQTIRSEDEGRFGRHADGRAFIRFERSLNHPRERVWQALSTPEGMAQWLAHRAEIEPVEGGHFALWLGGPGNDATPIPGVVLVFDPPAVLEVEGGGEDGVMRWELRAQGDGCLLTFTHTLLLGERVRNSVVAGWHQLLEHLPEMLEGRATDWLALEATRNAQGVIARIEEIYWHYRNAPRV